MKSTKTTDIISVGPRLKIFRETAGLSVNEIAAHIGYSRSGIEKMERPDANPTVKSIELYLRACGKTLGELFRNNERPSRRTA